MNSVRNVLKTAHGGKFCKYGIDVSNLMKACQKLKYNQKLSQKFFNELIFLNMEIK